MLVLSGRTLQVCTIDLVIFTSGALLLSKIVSLTMILYTMFELVSQITLTYLLGILARRLLMLPYLHASLHILLARKFNSTACSLQLWFCWFFDWLHWWKSYCYQPFCVDAEMQGSCGIRRLVAPGVLVSFLFAISRSTNSLTFRALSLHLIHDRLIDAQSFHLCNFPGCSKFNKWLEWWEFCIHVVLFLSFFVPVNQL